MRRHDLKSLGQKSELIFVLYDGVVEERADYLVVRTLTNPTFFWGNLLIFNRPPKVGDFDSWVALFKKEFTDPRIYHQTFAWEAHGFNDAVGDAEQFTLRGFSLQPNAVMTAKTVTKPKKYNPNLEIRVLKSEKDWADMAALQISVADPKFPKTELERFYRNQTVRYQGMEQAGMGHWYGGFIDGKLVATLGLYHRDGLGRFQSVVTGTDHQRQGLCSTLVYEAASRVLREGHAKELVMCADPGYHALKVYESVGFQTRHTEYGVSWFDRSRA